MRIRYYQQNGRVGVSYELDFEEIDVFMKSDVQGKEFSLRNLTGINLGLVPEEVQSKGKEAIKEYAEKICRERHEQKVAEAYKTVEMAKQRRSSVDRVIDTVHANGTKLIGRILNNNKGKGVRVFLEKPYRSEESIVFMYPTCFAEAMGGRQVFDDYGNLTERVIKDSCNALIGLYDGIITREKHGKQIDLVNELNGITDNGNSR